MGTERELQVGGEESRGLEAGMHLGPLDWWKFPPGRGKSVRIFCYPTFCTVAHLQRLAPFPSAHTFALSLPQKSPVALCHWPAGVFIHWPRVLSSWKAHLMPGDALPVFPFSPFPFLLWWRPLGHSFLCSAVDVLPSPALGCPLVSLYISVSSVEL